MLIFLSLPSAMRLLVPAETLSQSKARFPKHELLLCPHESGFISVGHTHILLHSARRYLDALDWNSEELDLKMSCYLESTPTVTFLLFHSTL